MQLTKSWEGNIVKGFSTLHEEAVDSEGKRNQRGRPAQTKIQQVKAQLRSEDA